MSKRGRLCVRVCTVTLYDITWYLISYSRLNTYAVIVDAGRQPKIIRFPAPAKRHYNIRYIYNVRRYLDGLHFLLLLSLLLLL